MSKRIDDIVKKGIYKNKIVYYLEYGTPSETKYFVIICKIEKPEFLEVKKSELKTNIFVNN